MNRRNCFSYLNNVFIEPTRKENAMRVQNVLSTGIVFCIFCDRCIIIRIQHIYILCIKAIRLKLLFCIRRKNGEIFVIEFESTK